MTVPKQNPHHARAKEKAPSQILAPAASWAMPNNNLTRNPLVEAIDTLEKILIKAK